MRVLVLGAGGVGGTFGGRLAAGGVEVTFLVRPRRAEQLRQEGLRLRSPDCPLREVRQFQIWSDPMPPIPHDRLSETLVIVAPKAYDLESSLQTLERALGTPDSWPSPGPILLPLLNGLAHLDRLKAWAGADRVAAGVAHIAAVLRPDGVVEQLNALHRLTFGPLVPAQAPRLQELYSACLQADFETYWAPDPIQMLWEKWSFLATLAGSTTLFRGSVGAITSTPEGAALMRRMYAECLAVAMAEGYPSSKEAQSLGLSILMEPGSAFTASMLRDLLGGNPTEHEHILGEMMRRGLRHGVDMPLISAAYIHMRTETQHP